jgi:hypothetical protein
MKLKRLISSAAHVINQLALEIAIKDLKMRIDEFNIINGLIFSDIRK